MHYEILSAEQKSALALLGVCHPLQPFYLAGGTALALHLGHRKSVDFDFFQESSFDPQRLLSQLPAPPPIRVLQEERDTLTVEFRGAKVSFFRYPYPLVKPLENHEFPFPIASLADIAAMKLTAIAGRGSRKDFVDIYFLCQECFSLQEAFTYLQAKFPQQDYDLYHILRSLTYFQDAEAEPMPLMLRAMSWENIKGFFLTEATRLRF